MAKLSTKDRKKWLTKLRSGKVKMWQGNTFTAHFGFPYPKTYSKRFEPTTKRGDARINGSPLINPYD